MRLDLILLMGDIYQPEPTQYSLVAVETLSLKTLNISQIITKITPISTKIVMSYAMKWGILFWVQWNGASCFEFVGKSMEVDTTTSEFPNGVKTIVQQILASEERKKSGKAGLWKSQSGIQVGNLTIWVRSFERKIITVHQVYQFHQNRLASP